MNKIIKQLIVIPLLVLFVLMFVTLNSIIDVNTNYIFIVVCLVFGIGLKLYELYLINKNEKHKKEIKLFIFGIIVAFGIFLFIFFNIKTIKTFILGITTGSPSYLNTLSFVSTFKCFGSFIIYYLLFILSYFWSKYVFFDKHISVLLYGAFAVVLIYIVINMNVSIIQIIMISLILLITIMERFYKNINNINPYLLLTIISVFLVISFSSYLLTPVMDNINIKTLISSLLPSEENNENEEPIDYVLDSNSIDNSYLSDKETTSFIEPKNKDYLENYNDTKGERIIDIETTFEVDRIKSYTMSKYNIETNSFVLSKEVANPSISNTSDLFIRNKMSGLPERMMVAVHNSEKLVYYPYGDLSFSTRAYMYNDAVIQFVDDKDYKNYSIYFNPYAYNNELLDKLVSDTEIEISDYHQYANLNYALTNRVGNINFDNLPKPIYDSIELFIKNYNLKDFDKYYQNLDNPSDFYYEMRKNVSLVNYILANSITVDKEYDKNNQGLDDVSYCLLYSKKANPQLLTELAVMMYRYYDIPARFVMGYRINGYEGNNATIYENDKACWAEVFIGGKWLASDTLMLPGDDQLDAYGINDDITGDISKAFKGDMENDPIILTVTSDYKIERLKQSSFGDYNPEKRSFELEEDINSYKSFKRIAALYNVDDYFKKLVINKEELSKNITISTYGDSDNVYIPYGNVSINNVNVYQDKKLLLKKHTDKYSYTFNPYDSNYHYSSDALYDNYVYEKYLNVPSSMDKELKDFLTANGIDYNSTDKNLIIKQIKYILQGGRYKYSKNVNFDTNEDYLLYFLNVSKEGFCQHFAGAATLLLRECGIPARYTVGFIVEDSDSTSVDVRASKAHSWVEVYTSNLGWCPVEVTVGEYIKFDLSELFPDGVSYDNVTLNFVRNNSSKQNEQKEVVKENDNDETSVNTYDSYPKSMSNVTAKIMNNEIEINDQMIMEIESTDDLHYLKAYATGDYYNGGFEIEENIDNLSSIQTIKSLYDIDNYFLKFTNKELDSYSHSIKVKNYSANNYVYYPYGTIKIDDIYMYQDKCLYFNDDNNYLEYDVKYNDLNQNVVEDTNYDYENYVYEKYTSLPNDNIDVLIRFLNENNINYRNDNKLETIINIQNLLLNNYTYTTKAINNPKDIDPVVYFLIVSKQGNASHFASAATLLYRICDIPARYVQGYYLDNKSDGRYSISRNNAHNWTEVYSSNLGWVNIETTPGFVNDEVLSLKFDRHIKLENHMEFSKGKIAVDRLIIIVGSAVSVTLLLIVGSIIYKAKKKYDEEYKKLLEHYGIKTPEQLKLLKDINSKYLLLKKYNYYDKNVEKIMYRIRYSKNKENNKDLKYLEKQVKKMMNDVNYNASLNMQEKIKKIFKKTK